MDLVKAKDALRDARNDALWLWLTAKRDIMSEVMADESNPEWARKEAKQSYDVICDKLERLGRKMDDAADAAWVGEVSDTPDTPDTRKVYYQWDPIRMINVEVEDYND